MKNKMIYWLECLGLVIEITLIMLLYATIMRMAG